MNTDKYGLTDIQVRRLIDLLDEEIGRVKSGELSGFGWTADEEIAELADIRKALTKTA